MGKGAARQGESYGYIPVAIASGRVTNSFGWSTARSTIGMAARVQTLSQVWPEK